MRRSERLVPLPPERTVLDTPLRQAMFFGGLLLLVIAGLALAYFGRHWL